MRTEHYELLSIVPSTYTSDEVEKINTQLRDIIAELGGTVIKEENLGKLKFAYQIDNMSHGTYLVHEFDLPTDKLAELNETLRLTKEVLRTMVVKKKIRTAEEIQREAEVRQRLAVKEKERLEAQEAKEEGKKRKPVRKKEKEKVSKEDLDKKLDQMLGGEDML